MDGTPDVLAFAPTLEKACVGVVESDKMDEGLAILVARITCSSRPVNSWTPSTPDWGIG